LPFRELVYRVAETRGARLCVCFICAKIVTPVILNWRYRACPPVSKSRVVSLISRVLANDIGSSLTVAQISEYGLSGFAFVFGISLSFYLISLSCFLSQRS